jgi:hypothetical protein
MYREFRYTLDNNNQAFGVFTCGHFGTERTTNVKGVRSPGYTVYCRALTKDEDVKGEGKAELGVWPAVK